MKNIIVLLVISLMIITLASAETFKQSTNIDFKKTCTNSSSNICSNTAACNVTIKYPVNNSYVLSDGTMTNNNNGIFNYTLNNFDILGEYTWDMFCCDKGDCGEAHGTFAVTKDGFELKLDKAVIYIGSLALLIIMFVFILGVIPFLPSRNNTNEDDYFVSINNLKYLKVVLYAIAWGLLLAILFTSSNVAFLYLESEMMGKLLFSFFSITMWMTLPMTILWLILIFVNIFRDKEMKRLIERGIQIRSTP